jgi:hypothetical protein
MAAAGIIGGILSGIGSAIGGQQQQRAAEEATTGQKLTTGLVSGGYDPVTSLASLDALAQMGYYDPSVLTAASPFNQAIAQFNQAPIQANVRAANLGLLSDIQQMLDQGMGVEEIMSSDALKSIAELTGGKAVTGLDYEATLAPTLMVGGKEVTVDPQYLTAEQRKEWADTVEERRKAGLAETRETVAGIEKQGRSRKQALEWLASIAGLSPEELLRQEVAHRERRQQYEAEVVPVAERIRQQRLSAMERLGGLPEQMPGLADIESLKAMEMARLDRELGDAEKSMLMRANVGGYNPAGGLAQIAEAREDADLTALQRAIALVGGQQGILGQQAGIMGSVINPGQAASTNLAGIRLGEGAAPQQVGQTVVSNAGDYYSAAGANLGGALAAYGQSRQTQDLIDAMAAQNRPAAGGYGSNVNFGRPQG